jgi:hypothetical protein
MAPTQGGAAIMTKRPTTTGGSRERRAEVDRELDEALEETFPASDPLAMTRTSAGAPDHPAPKPAPRGRTAREKGNKV